MSGITNVRFEQRRGTLRVRYLENDRLVDSFDGQQGGDIRSRIGQLRITPIGRVGGEVRAFLDQTDGIGIAARDDSPAQREFVDNGESLRFRLLNNRNYDSALSATVQLDRLTNGSLVTVSAFYNDRYVGQQTYSTANFTFNPGGMFDTLVVKAEDGSQFTLRSIDFSAVKSTHLSYERGEGLLVQAAQDDVIVGQVQGSQNGQAPSVGPFFVFANNSFDPTDKPNYQDFVDRTFLDQGEGIGIIDGEDASNNSGLRKRIDGDEVLGIAITGYEAALAVFDVGNVSSPDGASIRLRAYTGSTLVKDQTFFLGSSREASLSFPTYTNFNSIYLSPGDSNTSFTFLGADFGASPL